MNNQENGGTRKELIAVLEKYIWRSGSEREDLGILQRPAYSLGPQGELGTVDGWHHFRDSDHESVYRIMLTVGAAIDMGQVAPVGDESSVLGSIKQLLGRRY